jgi:hypothetical protein
MRAAAPRGRLHAMLPARTLLGLAAAALVLATPAAASAHGLEFRTYEFDVAVHHEVDWTDGAHSGRQVLDLHTKKPYRQTFVDYGAHPSDGAPPLQAMSDFVAPATVQRSVDGVGCAAVKARPRQHFHVDGDYRDASINRLILTVGYVGALEEPCPASDASPELSGVPDITVPKGIAKLRKVRVGGRTKIVVRRGTTTLTIKAHRVE